MDSKHLKPEPSPQTTDLLGDTHALELTAEGAANVKKEWGNPKGGKEKTTHPVLMLTTREPLKIIRVPRCSSRFEKVLDSLRPQFKKVFPYITQVTGIETDTGRQILSGGFIANAALNQNGYCVALSLTVAESKTMKTQEFQLLQASFSMKHKKRDRKALVNEWRGCHSKIFKNDDITRNLSNLFDVTERTIYTDLKETSKNA